MKRRNIREWLKKGNAELISFLCLTPLIITVIFGVMTLIKLTSLKQKMEYTTYVACRAAAVSNTYKEAIENAKKVVGLEISSYSDIFNIDDYEVKLTAYSPGTYPEEINTLDLRTNKSATGKWKKGNFVKCVLTVKLNEENVFLSGNKECIIHMAIEKENY